jgi:hypothetical protein
VPVLREGGIASKRQDKYGEENLHGLSGPCKVKQSY